MYSIHRHTHTQKCGLHHQGGSEAGHSDRRRLEDKLPVILEPTSWADVTFIYVKSLKPGSAERLFRARHSTLKDYILPHSAAPYEYLLWEMRQREKRQGSRSHHSDSAIINQTRKR